MIPKPRPVWTFTRLGLSGAAADMLHRFGDGFTTIEELTAIMRKYSTPREDGSEENNGKAQADGR